MNVPQSTTRVEQLERSLRRCAFLLNSCRLVIKDQQARDIAGQAVVEANALLKETLRSGLRTKTDSTRGAP